MKRTILLVAGLIIIGLAVFLSMGDTPPVHRGLAQDVPEVATTPQVEPQFAERTLVANATADSASKSVEAAPKDPATIRGSVIDSNNRPVSGIVASLKCGADTVRSAPTNHRGEFEIPTTSWGKKGIVIIDESSVPQGYLPPWRQEQTSIATADANFPAGFHAKEITVPPSGQSVSVALRLFLAGAGCGQIVTASGHPVPNAWIRLQSRIAGLNGLEMSGKSDDSGLVVIERLYPGKYRIEVDLAEVPAAFRNLASPIPMKWDVPEGASQVLPTIVIGQGTTRIFGSVVNQDGMPYRGLEVICYPKENSVGDEIPFTWNSSVARTFTDEMGRFELPAVVPFTYGIFVGRNAFDISNPVGTLSDGTKKLAYWKEEILADARAQSAIDLGVIKAIESRPFVFKGTVVPPIGFAGKLETLRVDIEFDEATGSASDRKDPSAIPSFQKTVRVGADGTFEWQCNTPHPMVKMTVRGKKLDQPKTIEVFPNAEVPTESRVITL